MSARTLVVQLRVSPEERERMDALAREAGVKLSVWVRRQALKEQFAASSVLPSGARMTAGGVEPQPDLDPPDVAPKLPAGAPRSEAFVCPVASCPWPGAKKQADGPCPRHGRNLIPRRS